MSTGARRVLANTGYLSVAELGSKVASLALYVVLARQVGSASFGVYVFGLSFVSLVTTLADFGQDPILTREVSRDRARLGEYFANTLALKGVLALPALALALGVLAVAGSDQETIVVALLLGLAVIAERLMATCFAVFQAYERLGLIPVALVSQRLLTAVVGITALLLGAGVVAVAGIYLAVAVFALALAGRLLVRRVTRPPLEVDVSRWRPLMRVALPVGIAGVFATVLFRADMAMLAAFKPETIVGEYGAAYRLFESTLFLSWSVGGSIYPVFSRLTTTTEPPIRPVFESALKLVLAFTLPLAAGSALLAGPLVEALYGQEFDASASALALLAPAIALYPVCYVAGHLLVAQGRQAETAWTYGAAAVANLVLNLVLIPTFSLNGAAVAASLSLVLIAVALLTFSLRVTSGLDWRRIAAGPTFATALATGAMALLHGSLALAVPVGAVVYVVTLLGFEQLFFPEDARVLWSLPRGRTA